PAKSQQIQFKNMEDPVKFSIGAKNYVLPGEDCCLLPTTSTSAEELSRYFAEYVYRALKKLDTKMESVQICVNEGIGQGAYYTVED
ncbi:MAG: 6-carboxytetrahydropterin synthase QueD, partial [Methanobacteriaceae archaeon]|nr:6-carboxytetrahydropterin synthase QueD [Methanobacteriaceae archaeon]